MAPDPTPPLYLPLLKGEKDGFLGTAEALRRLAAGRDAEAWAWILQQHGAEIVRATARILDDQALAEDACQETLLQIRDRAGQFRGAGPSPDASARNWIMRIACNTALHILRKRRHAKDREDAKAYQQTPVVIDVEEQQALARLVRTELADLPEKQRRPLLLRFFSELNYDQVATELGCSEGNARVRVHRALEKLRERLAVLGLAVTLAALYSILESAPAYAAEAVLSPERYQRWHELLFSSQQAAVNVLSDGNFPAMAKVSYAAATAMLAGSLAFGFPSSGDARAPQTPRPLELRTDVAKPTAEPFVASAPAAMPQTPRVPALRSDLAKPKADARETPAARLPERPSNGNLVSPLTQLRLLYVMQQEVNARVAEVYRAAPDDGRGGKLFTQAQLETLRRAADDQAQLARLAALMAEEFERQ